MVGRIVLPLPLWLEVGSELSLFETGVDGGGSGPVEEDFGGVEMGAWVVVVEDGEGFDNSLTFTPGQGADDDDFLPECGKKLEREREAATAPHS